MSGSSILDIIIINYNSTDHLLACLKSISEVSQGLPVRVFVHDNASKDNVGRVTALHPSVNLHKNYYNVGFSKALNRAFQDTAAPYVLILNPDTYVKKGFFDTILEFMAKNTDVGVLGPKILDEDGVVQASARSHPTPLTAFFGRTSMLTKWFPNNPITIQNLLTLKSDGLSPMEVDWVSGACMVVRREAMEEVGPLDEHFFMYWEDADWCRRMRESGWKVVYFPRASVVHYVGGSSERALIRSITEFHKSIYWLFHKYNMPSQWFLEPMVIAGLSLRAPLVLTSNIMRVWAGKRGFVRRHREVVFGPATDKRIKVLRMIARLNIGGPSIHVHILTRGLNKERFQSVLVAGKISSQEGDMSYLFDSQDCKPLIISELQREISVRMDLKAFFQILKLLRREKPDIVHTHTAKAGTSSRFAVFLYNLIGEKKVRMVHTFHGNVFEGYFGKAKSRGIVLIERLLAKETDVVIAVSKSQKRELAEKYRIASPEKIKTVELGFDLHSFFENERVRGQFRDSLGIDAETLLVSIVGRLVPIKNHVMFLRAAKRFLEQSPQVRAGFAVIGDGELRDKLEAYRDRLGLHDHVRFCGWMRGLPAVYADTNILALTSQNEGTPVSIIEAMASSIPVIATDAGGVLDLLGPQEDILQSNGFVICERGILCRKNDHLGFARGLKYLAEADKSVQERLSRRGRTFVEQRFSEGRLLRDIEGVYLDLVGERYGDDRP
jgi:GT2 family glycosyltransferase/glycosyltransferase involved in cell wall biosynthesis